MQSKTKGPKEIHHDHLHARKKIGAPADKDILRHFSLHSIEEAHFTDPILAIPFLSGLLGHFCTAHPRSGVCAMISSM